MNEYDDILRLPHPVSRRRPPMSRLDRASQFAPFAALTGYETSLTETARVTQEFRVLEEGKQVELNEKLCLLQTQTANRPKVVVTYFQPDTHKAGGAYMTATGDFQKIDQYEQCLYLSENRQIPLSRIYEIESPIFP